VLAEDRLLGAGFITVIVWLQRNAGIGRVESVYRNSTGKEADG